MMFPRSGSAKDLLVDHNYRKRHFSRKNQTLPYLYRLNKKLPPPIGTNQGVSQPTK